MSSTVRKYLTLLVLGLAGGSIYILPYMSNVFYDQLMTVLDINNSQSGTMLSVYSWGCVLLYIPGGILADRFAPRVSLSVSLAANAALTAIFAFTMEYRIALVLWALMALASGFVFWTAILKAIRLIGDSQEQGRMYGIYYGANGAATALINMLCLQVYDRAGEGRSGLFWATVLIATFSAVSALLIWVLLGGGKADATPQDEVFRIRDVGQVLTMPSLWLISVVFFCLYAVYSFSRYFSPFLVLHGMAESQASNLAVLRINVAMCIASPIGGFLADRVTKSTLKLIGYGSGVLTVSLVAVVALADSLSLNWLAVLTLIPGWVVMAVYGVMFSSFTELRVPAKVAGTAIGIASIIAYSPDLFLPSVYGGILDDATAAGHEATAYPQIFLSLAAMTLLSMVIAFWLRRRSLVAAPEPDADAVAPLEVPVG